MIQTLILILALLGLSLQGIAQQPIPQVASGSIERIEHFRSQYVASRHIDVWLPEGYSDTVKHAVLYMHDGQMLFDPAITWNRQAWNVDDVATELFASGQVKRFIVVGIWNSGPTRHAEYFPQKPFELLSQTEKDSVNVQLYRVGRTREAFKPTSDNYLKFIVHELKPYIDKNFSVHPDRENTFMAGSSMGGLISLYALLEYPMVFGGVACLSTHWIGTLSLQNNPAPNAFLKYLEKNLPQPPKHRIYFDTGDQTLDALYPEIQKQVDLLMTRMGYTESHWITKYFPGEDHSEKSWNKRLHIPLMFLFGK
ncbi:MAG TPA: alpha/beta hydrolase-fold protein [Bacteroidales bacterium]|nr:alpha/beta hydrolase-fold protein [Bacteroidales bacterium]